MQRGCPEGKMCPNVIDSGRRGNGECLFERGKANLLRLASANF